MLPDLIDIKRVNVGTPDEPVTLPEVRDHLIINSNDDDELLNRMIAQCREAVENFCCISIVAKQITLTARLSSTFELPYGPVTGISSVGTRSGTEGSGPVSYNTSESWAQEGEDFISFIPQSGFAYNPFVNNRLSVECGPVYRIVYTAGYSVVPEDLKLAILNEIAYRYENRGNVPNERGLCEASQLLAWPHRRIWF
jgi:hypothetical protein